MVHSVLAPDMMEQIVAVFLALEFVTSVRQSTVELLTGNFQFENYEKNPEIGCNAS